MDAVKREKERLKAMLHAEVVETSLPATDLSLILNAI